MNGKNLGSEKRRQTRVVNASGDYLVQYVETIAEQVVVDNTLAGISSTNLQGALKEINDNAKDKGVTSVNSKTGAVTLTASDVNALPNTTKYGKTVELTYTTSSGALTITLKDQDGTTLATESVNLPKEMFVESGVVKECTTPNVPVEGYVVGDKYIELTLNSGTKINIKVSDLVDQISGSTTGTGNVISSATVSGNKITFTKGVTAVTSVAGKTGAIITLAKGDVGLGNVDDTADTNKNVATARTLKTARNIKISGDVSGNADFDGGSNIDITTTLPTISSAKTGMSVYNVDTKGRVTSSGTLIEFGKSGANTPSANLVVGGIFFELQ